MELTNKEKQLLIDIEKREKLLPVVYMMICLAYILAILSFGAGFRFKSKDGYLGTLYFATVGTFLLTGIISQQKLYCIIKKLRK
jgi:hypothetical protein